jgi:hypothetical protein
MKRIVPPFVLAALAVLVLLAGMPASSAYAFDPPWPAGIPWPTTVPWPTASPLTIGVPWSPAIQSYPVYVAPAAPLPSVPVVPAPAVLPPVVVSSGVPVATPLPPVVVSSFGSAPLPPVVVPSNNSAPIVPVSGNPAPANVAPPATDFSGGSSRASALPPGDAWHTLGAGASLWYRIGTSGNHIDVWLEATPLGGVGMLIYAPNGSDVPIGRGTLSKDDRLGWSGGHWSGEGYWYALVTNGNPMSIQYRITSSQQDISNKSCWSYWEYIGSTPVYWTKCQ